MSKCIFCQGRVYLPGNGRFGEASCRSCSEKTGANSSGGENGCIQPVDHNIADVERLSTKTAKVAGWWHGSDGLNYYIRQSDDRFVFEGTDASTGTPIIEGEGSIKGSSINLRFLRLSGLYGTARARIKGDGRRIIGVETLAETGEESKLLLSR